MSNERTCDVCGETLRSCPGGILACCSLCSLTKGATHYRSDAVAERFTRRRRQSDGDPLF